MAQINRGFVAGATDSLFSPVEPDLLKLNFFAGTAIRFKSS